MIHYIFWWWQPCIHLSSVKRAPCFRHFAGFPTGRVAHCFLGGAMVNFSGFCWQICYCDPPVVVFGWNVIFCNKFSSFTSGGLLPELRWIAASFFGSFCSFCFLNKITAYSIKAPGNTFFTHMEWGTVFFCHNLTSPRFCDLFPLIQWDFQTVSSFWTFPKSNVDHFNKTLGLFQLKIFPF